MAVADFAITQFFFDPEMWVRLVDQLADLDCTTPVIPGIMPVRDVAALERMTNLAGASIPTALHEQFDRVRDDPAAVERLGIDVAAELAAALLEAGAPGLHFYCLNRARAATEIFTLLGLGSARRHRLLDRGKPVAPVTDV